MTQATVLAAGVLCWHAGADGEARVLLVRRAYYDDLSIPKGKVDPGELMPQTAVRELKEETGVDAVLGAPIGEVRYRVKAGPKLVQYWLAEVGDEGVRQAAAFEPNEEIAAVEWMPLPAAIEAVTYPHDAEMLRTLRDRLDAGTARTFAIVVERHGKAVPPSDWDGPDATRPLLHRGLEQAVALAPAIAAFGPERLVSSTATRCLTTIEPVSRLTGVPVKASDGISQDAYEAGRSKAGRQVAKRIDRGRNVVLCSHGPVIPVLVGAIAERTGAKPSSLTRAARQSTGEAAVFHIVPGKRPALVAWELLAA